MHIQLSGNWRLKKTIAMQLPAKMICICGDQSKATRYFAPASLGICAKFGDG